MLSYVAVLGVKKGGLMSGLGIQVMDIVIWQTAQATLLLIIYQESTVLFIVAGFNLDMICNLIYFTCFCRTLNILYVFY